MCTLEKKRGGSKVRDPMSEKLMYLISDWDIQDIRPLKGNYTWSNRRTGLNHIAARLDHFLISSDFLLTPLDIGSCIIPSALSDHKMHLCVLISDTKGIYHHHDTFFHENVIV
jgi:hypothetical protein